MHGYSTLDADKPRDPAKLIATSKQMADFLREPQPEGRDYLMATWSRADQMYPAAGAWAGSRSRSWPATSAQPTTRPPPGAGVRR